MEPLKVLVRKRFMSAKRLQWCLDQKFRIKKTEHKKQKNITHSYRIGSEHFFFLVREYFIDENTNNLPKPWKFSSEAGSQ